MMAQVPVQIRYAENRLSALRMFLGDEQSTVEKELTACLDRLWEEKIPENVRDFIERSEKREQADKVRERRKQRPGRCRRKSLFPRLLRTVARIPGAARKTQREGLLRGVCPPWAGEGCGGRERRKGGGNSEENASVFSRIYGGFIFKRE